MPDIAEWVTQLNQWKDGQFDEWVKRPSWDDEDGRTSRGGAELMAYGAPKSVPSCAMS